ncbi:MAG: ABC transporter permease [Anaerolineales bacterium]|nr:ABC transporter permease [Anaerolineales bacterium]
MRLFALTRRGFLQAASYRLSFFGNYLGAALVLVFYRVLADFLGRAQPGEDYFTFLLIGGVLARFFSLSLKQFARELEHELAAGTLEPLLVTATPPALALLGPALWTLVEGLLIAAAQLAAGALFLGADFSRADWPAALGLGALTFTALAGWGLLSAAFVLVFKRSDPLSWLADVTLYMFAGVYFPISALPELLRPLAYLLPLSHGLEGLRLALLHGQSFAALGRYALILAGFSVALGPLGVWAIHAALRQVRRTGSLGHY